MKNGFMNIVLAGGLLFCGCASPVRDAVSFYQQEARQIRLGMDKEAVLAILEPTQEELPLNERRPPEQYTDVNDVLTEVHFYRSQAYFDDMLTDDEFTPYVFRNGKLSAIGWTALGGPKTQGMPYQPTRYHMGVGYGYHRWD